MADGDGDPVPWHLQTVGAASIYGFTLPSRRPNWPDRHIDAQDMANLSRVTFTATSTLITYVGTAAGAIGSAVFLTIRRGDQVLLQSMLLTKAAQIRAGQKLAGRKRDKSGRACTSMTLPPMPTATRARSTPAGPQTLNTPPSQAR